MARTIVWWTAAFAVLIAQGATTQVWVSPSSVLPHSAFSSHRQAAGSGGRAGPAASGIAISPAKVKVRGGETRRFFANVEGVAAPQLTWRVNGVQGGSAVTGTISMDGMFTAPPIPPKENEVVVEAVI